MKYFLSSLVFLFLTSCASHQISKMSVFPAVDDNQKITLLVLNNYTTTPQAGLRASNLIEGILVSRGYSVIRSSDKEKSSLSEQLSEAKKNDSSYLINGGVTEWRYKTGIDGEPAISLQFKLIDVDTNKVMWSATASGNDWGNASIGTTAQAMIESMLN